MNISQSIAALLSAAALTTVAGAAVANNQIASTLETSGAITDFTFTGGAGGTFASNGALAVFASGPSGGATASTFSFGPITETSAVSNGVADFSGGSFTIDSLLTGTFTASQLSSTNGSSGSVLNMTLDNVTYTGGTFLSQFNALYGGSGATGNLSLGLSAINPTLSVGADGYYKAFAAQGSVSTFDATPSVAPVPEPSAVAPFAFGAIGLLALALRARKSAPRTV